MSQFGHGTIKRISQVMTIAHGASVTTAANANVALDGLLWQVNIMTPAADDGSATITFNIIDADGVTVVSKASLAVNTTYTLAAGGSNTLGYGVSPVALSGLYTVEVVFSGNQTTTNSVTNATLIIQAP